MTREEHIYQLKQYLQGRLISMCPSSSLYWQEHWEEVIKALEQEPVLDKIRAEIEQLSTSTCAETRRIYIDADDFKENVLAILDKYKTDKEQKDDNT